MPKGCCRETGCQRVKPPLLRRGGLTGRIYLLMDYEVKSPNLIVAKRRHDVTEQVEAFMRSEGWEPVATVAADEDDG
jgi:hypothetical protein